MTDGGYRMIRGRGLILAMTVAFASACASGGGGGEMGAPESGNPPRDNDLTNSANTHIVQAGLTEGAEAEEHYEAALADALAAIEQDSTNPKGYLIAGQAAIGLEEWAQADSLLAEALELHPPYEEQVVSEREQAWVTAYNTGAEALDAGDIDEALEMFEGADQIYRDRPEARMALGSLYMSRGSTEEAAEAYRGALEILSGPPPEGMNEEQVARWEEDRQVAAFNAAQLSAESGDFDDAASILEGYLAENEETLDEEAELQAMTALAGFLAQADRTEEAEALYDEIYAREGLASDHYFQIGIGFFNTGDYGRAAEAFQQAAELNPYSRDALLNLVQALYSQAVEIEEEEQDAERDQELNRIYDQLIEAADQVRDFDPMNRNLLSFILRSLRAKADLAEGAEAEELAQRTQALYRNYQEQPYGVSDIAVSLQGEDQARVSGVLTNLTGTAGDEVQLRFAFLDGSGSEISSSTVTVTVPEQNAETQFNTTIEVAGGEFAGWRYEIVD